MNYKHVFICFFLFFASTLCAKDKSPGFLMAPTDGSVQMEGNTEVIYFFSYHCPACYAMHETVNIWSLVAPSFKRVPVFRKEQAMSDWKTGAKIYFTIKTAASIRNGISQSDLDRIGFALTNEENSEKWLSDNQWINTKLVEWGFTLKPHELQMVLSRVEDLLLEASRIVEDLEIEMGHVSTPMFRIYSPISGVDYVRIRGESDDPALNFVTEARDVIVKHHKDNDTSGVNP